jgi:hypothetical protein
LPEIEGMAFGLRIDFSRTYKMEEVSLDFRTGLFRSALRGGGEVLLKIEIGNRCHELMDNVYNLSFGPLNSRGKINDLAEVNHEDVSKVFSTVLLHSTNYMEEHPGRCIGVDGSTNSRAFYYWRFLQANYEYLNRRLEVFGIKYFVRISRFGKTQYDDPFDFDDISIFPEFIQRSPELPKQMFNYFILKLK